MKNLSLVYFLRELFQRFLVLWTRPALNSLALYWREDRKFAHHSNANTYKLPSR